MQQSVLVDFWSSCPEVPVARSFLQELYAVISAAVLPFKTHLCAQAVWLNRVRNMAVSRVRVIRTASFGGRVFYTRHQYQAP